MMKNDAAITVRGLRVVRGGRPVIASLDLDVPAGQVVGLLGPSGCGKTTLMRAIVGVQVVAGGSVEVLGHPAGARELRSLIGYVTQAPSVYADLTVSENLRYFAAVAGVPRARLHGEVDRLLDAVDLHARAGARVANLSGGQRSRVSLAAALAGAPRLLVLDEPTVGLDPVLRRDLWDIFARLAATGVTLLVSSHVMDEAARCDRLLLMREGRLLADGTLAGILADTATSAVEDAFLSLVERDRADSPADSPAGTPAKAPEVAR
ncbi:MAG: ABC transporter ATP-binding protein [Kineosporiaceae bacterium]